MSIVFGVRRPLPLWLRVVLPLWALWFTTALTEVGPLGSCLGHSHLSSAKSHASSGHAGHGSHAAASPQASTHTTRVARAGEQHAVCSCLGFCCCVPATALPEDERAALALELPAAAIAHWPGALVVIGRAPYAHPFANGPPVTESA